MNARTRPLHGKHWKSKGDFSVRELLSAAEFRVLGLINRKEHSPESERVVRLLQLLKRAEELRLQLYRSVEEDGAASLTYPYGQNTTEFDIRLAEINKALSRYRWTPRIASPQFSSLQDASIWDERNASYQENWAVRWLLWQSAGTGRVAAKILRFRQCEECRTWFFCQASASDHGKFCGEKCRKKFHLHRPEAKAKRARYMRELYRPLLKKRGDYEGRRQARKSRKGS
jgi:hypothetical protein